MRSGARTRAASTGASSRAPIVIHIGRGDGPHAAAGEIWLDASLLDSGRFSWGVIQHEYAHQVDFALLTDPMRARLEALLGGSSWWSGSHDSLACERFADASPGPTGRRPTTSCAPSAPRGRAVPRDARPAASRGLRAVDRLG